MRVLVTGGAGYISSYVSLLTAMSKAECNNIVFFNLLQFMESRNIYHMTKNNELIQ
jgi:UDP-glucose 4-epimerase